MDEFIGKRFDTFILAERQRIGEWKVNYKVVSGRSRDLKVWERRQVVITAFDINAEKAIASAMSTILQYLNSVDYDLFSDETLENNDTGLVN
ncbi:hypothetical protein LCGC14_1208510 [marine sediment metagenome]|uniref:Uncharacterized protein n=1 Tax=marine sediment metagenome TaxID=412755 RepID=A0A0F9LER0_9ZZZZ